jgi:hypothetical protein
MAEIPSFPERFHKLLLYFAGALLPADCSGEGIFKVKSWNLCRAKMAASGA